MPKIVEVPAYACNICAKTHDTEAKAIKCEKECRAKRNAQDYDTRAATKAKEITETISDHNELIAAVNEFFRTEELDFVLSCDCAIYSDCFITHSAPRGVKTEWGNYSAKRKGITVNWKYTYSDEKLTKTGPLKHTSEYDRAKWFLEHNLNLHFGTGGAYGQSGTIWVDDFPKIKERIKQETSLIESLEEEQKTKQKQVRSVFVSEACDLHCEMSDLEIQIDNLKDQLEELNRKNDKLYNDVAVREGLTSLNEEIKNKVKANIYVKAHFSDGY